MYLADEIINIIVTATAATAMLPESEYARASRAASIAMLGSREIGCLSLNVNGVYVFSLSADGICRIMWGEKPPALITASRRKI